LSSKAVEADQTHGQNKGFESDLMQQNLDFVAESVVIVVV